MFRLYAVASPVLVQQKRENKVGHFAIRAIYVGGC
jgi:hypothetical protein